MGESKLRILVADDEEGVLLALKEYLGCCGWEVDAARTATEAERFLETKGYAAVITDLRFSGPSGKEGLAIVRAARTHNPGAPVVVMTGYGSPDAEAEARRLGVDAFVPKPVPLWELARLVQGWAALLRRGVLRRTPLDPASLAGVNPPLHSPLSLPPRSVSGVGDGPLAAGPSPIGWRAAPRSPGPARGPSR